MRLKLRSITEVPCDGKNVPGHVHEGCDTHEFEFDVLDLPESHQQHNPYNANMMAVYRTAKDQKWPEDASTAELLTRFINALLWPYLNRGTLTPATVESVRRDFHLDKFIYKNSAGTEFILTYTPKSSLPSIS